MARVNTNPFGKPFVRTPVIVVGVSNLDEIQTGNWVKTPGDKRSSRLARDPQTGRAYLVSAPRGGRVSTAAFRLGCRKSNDAVLTSVR